MNNTWVVILKPARDLLTRHRTHFSELQVDDFHPNQQSAHAAARRLIDGGWDPTRLEIRNGPLVRDHRGLGVQVPWAGLVRAVRAGDSEARIVLEDALEEWFAPELAYAVAEAQSWIKQSNASAGLNFTRLPVVILADARILRARFLPVNDPRSTQVTPFHVTRAHADSAHTSNLPRTAAIVWRSHEPVDRSRWGSRPRPRRR